MATAITEWFCMGADGVLEPLTTGSIRPVAQVVTHAGICKVERSPSTYHNLAGIPLVLRNDDHWDDFPLRLKFDARWGVNKLEIRADKK